MERAPWAEMCGHPMCHAGRTEYDVSVTKAWKHTLAILVDLLLPWELFTFDLGHGCVGHTFTMHQMRNNGPSLLSWTYSL